jgi:signal transduction histidine kinase
MDKKKTESQSFFRELQIEFLIHELKDPLSIIETGTRMLLEKKEKYGELSGRQEKTLKRTLRNTQKVRQMLYDLLEIGRSEAGCFQCVCFQPVKAVYEVLLDALEAVSEPDVEECGICKDQNEIIQFLSGCGIIWDISPQLTDTMMLQDEVKFRQIVANLVKNGLYYRKERLEISMKQEDNRISVEVGDDGPGIAAEHHEMIFKRYAQVKEANENSALQRKGHGLGLAGALIVARYMGGDIEVKSRKGKGAMFRLTLPLNREE